MGALFIDATCTTLAVCRAKIQMDTVLPLMWFEPTKEQMAEITGDEGIHDPEEHEKEFQNFLKSKKMCAGTELPVRSKGKPTRVKDEVKAEDEDEAGEADSHSSSPQRGRGSKRQNSRAAKKRVVKGSDDDEDDFIDDSEEANPVAGYTKKTGAESDSEIDAFDSVSGTDEETDEDAPKGKGKARVKASTLTASSSKFREMLKNRSVIPSSKVCLYILVFGTFANQFLC